MSKEEENIVLTTKWNGNQFVFEVPTSLTVGELKVSLFIFYS